VNWWRLCGERRGLEVRGVSVLSLNFLVGERTDNSKCEIQGSFPFDRLRVRNDDVKQTKR
jgi:hypothetical protein